MIGIVVATMMLLFGIDLNSALLAFIGFELFGISLHLNYFHMADVRKRNGLSSFIKELKRGLEDGRGKDKDE